MAQTPAGTSTPYCSVTRLFVYHDWQQVADALRDGDGGRPTRQCLLDSTSDEGAMLLLLLLAASGELESAVMVGKRYLVADLQALTGSGLGRLEKLVADLAFWACSQRRQPMTANPDLVPGAKQALAELDRLRDGERIFGFSESAEAGLPTTQDPDVKQRPNEITSVAQKFFGSHRGQNFTR